jgi:uncharacterized protein YkwD
VGLLSILLLLFACSGAHSGGHGTEHGAGAAPTNGPPVRHVWAGPALFDPPEDVGWAYAAAARAVPGLEPDRRLARAAVSLTRIISERGGTPTREERTVATRDAEIAEPVPVLLVISSPDLDRPRLAELLREGIGRQCSGIGCNRIGIAIDADGPGVAIVALAMSSRLTLAPVPVRCEQGQPITLSGEVLADAEEVQILLSTPRGAVATLFDAEDLAFEASTRLEETGVYGIEVVGHLDGSPTVLGLVRIEVGAPGSAARSATPAGRTTDPVLARQRLLDLINSARRDAGLTPLALDETLARAAQAYAEAMLEQDFFGHQDPLGRGPAERVRDAGAQCSVVLENLAIARSAEEGHATLRESPIHWRATLDERTTHAGIGVAGTSADGLRMVILMARMLPPFDPDIAASDVIETIVRARVERNVPALRIDPAMSAAAAAAADAWGHDGGRTEDAQDAAAAALASGSVSNLTVVLLTTSDLADTILAETVLDASYRRAGVAVRLARAEVSAYHVVVLLAR